MECRPTEALRLAGRAVELTKRKSVRALDTLAAAYAAAGRMAEAIAADEDALRLAEAAGDAELASALRARLATLRREM